MSFARVQRLRIRFAKEGRSKLQCRPFAPPVQANRGAASIPEALFVRNRHGLHKCSPQVAAVLITSCICAHQNHCHLAYPLPSPRIHHTVPNALVPFPTLTLILLHPFTCPFSTPSHFHPRPRPARRPTVRLARSCTPRGASRAKVRLLRVFLTAEWSTRTAVAVKSSATSPASPHHLRVPLCWVGCWHAQDQHATHRNPALPT